MLALGQRDGANDAHFSLEEGEGYLYTHKTFTDCWYICSDNTSQTEDDVRALFVPLGTFYKGCYLRNVSPKEINTVRHPDTGVLAILWEVDLEYDSHFNPQQDNNNPQQVNPDDPTDTRPFRRLYSEEVEEVLEFDAQNNNVPIANVNGESVIVTHPVSQLVLEITRYEGYPSSGVSLIEQNLLYMNRVNDSTWYGVPRHCALMTPIHYDEEVITNTSGQNQMWLKATYKIKIRQRLITGDGSGEQEGFRVSILNEGYLVKEDAGSKAELYIDPKTKQPLKVNLAMDGTKLPDGASPVYLTFNRFFEGNFSGLGLEY